MLAMLVTGTPSVADDTCVFGVGASDVPPNIVFELDSGAGAEQIVWHADFNNNTDHTPGVADAWDVIDAAASGSPTPPSTGSTTLVLDTWNEDYPFAVGAEVENTSTVGTAIVLSKTYPASGELHLEIDTDTISGTFSAGNNVQRRRNKNNIATGHIFSVISPPPSGGGGGAPTNPNGFFNDLGYGIVSQGGNWYLVKVLNDLTLDVYSNGFQATSGNRWDITVEISGVAVAKSITLPAAPSSSAISYSDATLGAFSIIDNARVFRYSKNYLNWLFFGNYDGTSLDDPNLSAAVSRFWYAKLAILGAARLTSNNAKFGVYNFTNDDRSSSVQPLKLVVDTVVVGDPKLNVLDSAFVNNINNMNTVTESAPYSPLAEGLAAIGGYYNSPSSGVRADEFCQDQFVIVVSPGISSMDQDNFSMDLPTSLSDYDGDDAGGIGEGNIKVDSTTAPIPTRINGSTWLDDVARFMYTNDMVGYIDGVQNVITYTVGFLADWKNNAFLINTSNNGNGETNLYDTTDPNYGRWHFPADSPAGLVDAIVAAVNDIISRTTTFTAPVVPVTRTVSGDRIYLALFKPLEGNFWEGNLIKLGIATDGQIVDANGAAATWPNGALKDDMVPIWATKNWADDDYDAGDSTSCPSADRPNCNWIDNSVRKIYTYLGSSNNLTDPSNQFIPGNMSMTLLGSPTNGVATITNFVRGADALNTDPTKIADNRDIITGDIIHSESGVVQYDQTDPNGTVMVFYGSNDGMLHAVNDVDGTESWAFIPPDQLSRLKDMVEGVGHQWYVDGSPKVFIVNDDGDGVVEPGNTLPEQVILICGLRKGGSGYFALDVTDPAAPKFLWRIASTNDAAALGLPAGAAPDVVIPELGESWSEPEFGKIKNAGVDTDVFFIGAGFSADNSKGKAVLAIDVVSGAVVWQFIDDSGDKGTHGSVSIDVSDMDYAIPSAIKVVEGPNGFTDKVYVGDQGSQMFRIGKPDPANFPDVDQDITQWVGVLLFLADSTHTQKFFYPPGITLEIGYDLVFMVTGDREDPCNELTSDSVYAVKDDHTVSLTPLTPADLVDVTTAGPVVNLDGSDNGWFIDLAIGEKSLAKVTIFFRVLFFTTFTPNDDPCLPGGEARLYAVNYKTGEAVLDLDSNGSLERDIPIGGGPPSEFIIVITEGVTKGYTNVGSANPDSASSEITGGPVEGKLLLPPRNFFYLWWREIFG